MTCLLNSSILYIGIVRVTHFTKALRLQFNSIATIGGKIIFFYATPRVTTQIRVYLEFNWLCAIH